MAADFSVGTELLAEADLDWDRAAEHTALIQAVLVRMSARPTEATLASLLLVDRVAALHLLWLQRLGEDPEPARQRLLTFVDDLYAKLKSTDLALLSSAAD